VRRALRQAQRVCSAFGPPLPRSPELPSPPRAAFGQRRELGTQNRCLAAADHCGGAGFGKFNQQPFDTIACLLDQLTLDLDLSFGSIRAIARVLDVLAQHLHGL